VLDILKSDGPLSLNGSVLMSGKRYTLTVSNELPDKRPDGRNASTLLYESNFVVESYPMKVHLKWESFAATYRGKPKDGAPSLDLASIRSWSFMIRSFFDKQHGDFSISIRSVSMY
jgi:Complex I intermediate-associated protein 30 (CIA30)